MRILLTGGAGFIGGHTAEYLLKEGNEVVVFDCFSNFYDKQIKLETVQILKNIPNAKLKVVAANLQQRDIIEQLFREHKFEVVIHLAAQAGVRYSLLHPIEIVKENILGTVQLLEVAKDYNVRHFVMASSSSVYGKHETPPFNEHQKCDKPLSQYAASKRSCELFAYTYYSLYNIPVTCLRFFTVYGPRCRPDMACLKFIDGIYKGIPIDKYGDGSAKREFTYISDIVKGVINAIHQPNQFQVINLGGGSTHTLNELISTIEKHLEKKAIINSMNDQPGDVPLTCADQTMAKQLIGFEPTVSLDQGIKNTVEWYMEYVKSVQQTERNASLIFENNLHVENKAPSLKDVCAEKKELSCIIDKLA